MNESRSATPAIASTAHDGRLQPQLSALLNEVRAFGREVRRAAALRSVPGTLTYSACLSELFYNAVTQSIGRDQILYLAAAAECGVLQWRHLSSGAHVVDETSDRALRALYWATVKRWQRANVSGTDRRPPKPRTVRVANPVLCEHCLQLLGDHRRYAPHPGMRSLWDKADVRADSNMRSWYQCQSCDVLWLRNMPAHEPFAIWTVVRGASPDHAQGVGDALQSLVSPARYTLASRLT